jgi:hypothetical protein
MTSRAGGINLNQRSRALRLRCAYSAAANINLSAYVTNPGYATVPNSVAYFFSDRGEFRAEDLTATDLALNWTIPVSKVSFFAQGEILNVFNEQAVVAPASGITTFASRGNAFNPFTETPRECPQGTATATCVADGYHWRKNATFVSRRGLVPTSFRFTYRVARSPLLSFIVHAILEGPGASRGLQL